MKSKIVWGTFWMFVAALVLSISATFAHPQSTGPITTPQLNTVIFPGQVSGFYPTIQTAVTKGCTLAGASIVISPGSPATGTSGWTISAVTGGCTKASILDQRVTPAQPYTWNGSAYTATTGSSGTVGTGTTGQIAQYPANGTAVQGATVSGDATITAGGALSVNKINGVAITGTPTTGQVPTATSSTTSIWQTPTGGVTSFNTRTGAVTLTNADVNAVGTISNSTTGNATTSTALAATPTPCTNAFSKGIVANGNSLCLLAPVKLFGFGDSYIVGFGATNPPTTGIFGLLSRDTPTTAQNFAVSGRTTAQIADDAFTNFTPNATLPSVSIEDGGANDASFDTCGLTAGSLCILGFQNELRALEAWTTIPFTFRIMASNATSSGTWTADVTPVIAPTIYASRGTPMHVASSGKTLTFSVPSSASPIVGLTWYVTASATGTFTVSVDGTLQTPICTGTGTTFSAGPCIGTTIPAAVSTFYRQEASVTPNTTHTVVITTTNASNVSIIGVDWAPPSGTANENAVFIAGTNASFTGGALYNTASSTVAAQLLADGLPVFFVNNVNATTDVATSPTATCPASFPSGTVQHPNDCGYQNFLANFNTAEVANNYIFSELNSGGQVPGLTAQLQQPYTVQTQTGNAFNIQNTGSAVPAGELVYSASGNIFGRGVVVDSSSGNPFSGKVINVAGFVNNPFNWICTSALNGNTFAGPSSSVYTNSNYTQRWCSDVQTGNTFQLGTASLNGLKFIGGGAAQTGVQGSTGTNLFSCTGTFIVNHIVIDDANGNCVDSGVTVTGLALLAGSNTYTGANQFEALTTFTFDAEESAATNATSSANVNSPSHRWSGQFWNGTISTGDTWEWQNVLGTGTNPTSMFTLNHSGTPKPASVQMPFPITPDVLTVGTLPAAASLPVGTVIVVTDDTGLPGSNTCTGGGAEMAIAISNGLTWSCH